MMNNNFVQPVIIVFGGFIDNYHRNLIDRAIFQNVQLSLKAVFSFKFFFENFETFDLRNDLIIIVSHGCFSIEDSGCPLYFHGVDEVDVHSDTLISLRDRARYVWFAACMTSNIDVTFVETNYNPNPDYIPRRLHSLVPNGDVPGERFSPVITVSWLVSFFYYMRNFSWWTSIRHPIQDLSERLWQRNPFLRNCPYPLAVTMQNAFIRHEIRLNAAQWKRDDKILYPNHMSFPEIIHSAVFVALFPHQDLILLHNIEAKNKYQGHASLTDNVWSFFSKDLGTQGNTWFDFIRSYTLSNCNPDPFSFKNDEIYNFQLSLTLSRIEDFYNLAKSSKVPSLNELIGRLVCGYSLLPPTKLTTNKFIALTIRSQSHGSDWRVKCSDRSFLAFVRTLFERAQANGFGVVLMDGDSHNLHDIGSYLSSIKKQTGWKGKLVDLTSHHKSERRKAILGYNDPAPNLFINQILFLRHCVVKYNICGAIGIHSGFLDLLNLLGVPINKTYRFFGKHRNRTKEKGDIAHWKSRTDEKFLKFFYPGTDTTWKDRGVPNALEIDDFLKKL
eukprot:gene16609-18904_t